MQVRVEPAILADHIQRICILRRRHHLQRLVHRGCHRLLPEHGQSPGERHQRDVMMYLGWRRVHHEVELNAGNGLLEIHAGDGILKPQLRHRALGRAEAAGSIQATIAMSR